MGFVNDAGWLWIAATCIKGRIGGRVVSTP
jgi:hypothetical protein